MPLPPPYLAYMTEDVTGRFIFQFKDGIIPHSNVLKHVQVLIGGILGEVSEFRRSSVPVERASMYTLMLGCHLGSSISYTQKG